MSDTALSRRSFVKWSAAVAGLAAAAGTMPGGRLTKAAGASEAHDSGARDDTKGVWKTGACMNNCSCGASRCLLKVWCEDGVPIKIATDEKDADRIESLQRRACPRGRAQIANILSPARIKYPMKRKHWNPDNPHGELRGKDEWERISWKEALDYIAEEMRKTIEQYGTRGILCAGSSNIGSSYFDQVVCLLNALGGAVHHEMGTVSFGSWPVTETLMTGGLFSSPHPLSLADSELHLMFGCNWASNKAGNTPYQLQHSRENGGRVIIIDPWLNQTAQALADEWIPILPGTDTALMLGMAYHQIQNNLFDQHYLDTYCIGFDAEHMPEGSDPKDNFKDYVLGTYDGEPKTPEWAATICGISAPTIKRLAEEVGTTDKVNFYAE